MSTTAPPENLIVHGSYLLQDYLDIICHILLFFKLQNCTPGEYCAGDYLNITSGLCDEGFYCTLAASVPNPTDGITGQQDSESTLCSSFF